ncbi:MAG: M20/M25/M40 family metallo-hydrolase [Bacillota bacterium]|nr:M20/M25/M40 family metallo-hydrolase [Bacillota bacterium]
MITINKKRMLTEFFELVKTNSPTKDERTVADMLIERLRNLGMTVTEDNAGQMIGGNCGNIIANLKGTLPMAPIVLFSAHMDTVQPCLNIEPVLNDGLITAAGQTILGADDKSGIAPILEALRTLQEQAIPHGDIQVVFSVAEEGGLNGSKNIDKTKLIADLGYVLDSGGKPGNIIIGAPGQDRINITIKGKAAHAGVEPESGINAIVVAAQAISRLKTGRIDEETTSNIGTIQGGRVTNIVADRVEVTCETRSRNLGKLERLTAQMCEVFNYCAEEAGAISEIEVIRLYDPLNIAKESKIATLSVQAVKSAGLTAEFGVTGGGSDANNFNRYGVPCVVLGTGMQKYHTTDESIEEEDLYQSAKLLLEIIRAVAQIDKREISSFTD